MWKLISSSDNKEKFHLFVDAENVVGRKDCSVVLKNDPAISRKHALITITHPDNHLSHSHVIPTAKIKDMSKYGTFVNHKRGGEEVTLKSGDSVKFGSDKSKFKVVYEPFIITTSCLDPAMKKTVKGIVRHLGGHVVQEWQKGCNIVVMSNLSVTIKVMCALVSCANVVVPQYLVKLKEAMKNGEQEPDPTEFLPPLAESQINPNEVSFLADPSRQALFQGKMFIFLTSKQFKKLNLAIELGGGIPILMEEGSDDNDDSVLIAPSTCVMECSPTESSQQLSQNAQEWITHVMDYLKRHKKRPIPEAELGFAALYSSTDKYCNPDSDIGGPCLGAIPGPTLSQQPDLFPSLSVNLDASQLERKPPPRLSATATATKPSDTSQKPEAIQIKKEPISQIPDDSIFDIGTPDVSSISRKRVRGGAEADVAEPKPKQVKVERRSRSKSASPEPVKRELRSTSPAKRNNSTDNNKNELGEFDSIPPRRGRRTSPRKKSPTPERNNATEETKRVTRSRSPSKSPTPNNNDGGGDFGFDSLPPRGRGVKNAEVRGKGSRAKRSSTKEVLASDSDGDFGFDSVPARKSEILYSRHTIHAAETKSQTSPAKIFAAYTDDGEDLGFDSVPPRKSGRGATNTSASEHTVRPKSSPKKEPLASNSDDADTGFDSVPPRQSQRKTRSRSPAKVTGAVNEFDNVPARKGRSKRTDNVEDFDGVPPKLKKNSRKDATDNVTCVPETLEDDGDFEDLKSAAMDFEAGATEMEPAVSPSRGRKKPKTEPRVVPPSPTREGNSRVKTRDVSPPGPSRIVCEPEAGFLTTTRPIQDQPFIKSEDCQFDPDVPAACVQINFKSLVVRNPKLKAKSVEVTSGAPVKNFKKFKKTKHMGSEDLPRIIGGRDLVPHSSLAKKQIMEKFAEDLKLTQHDDPEEDCRDLFNALNVPERRGRGRR